MYLTQENWRKRPDQVRNCVQINYETYLRNTDDALLQLVLQHETKKKFYSIQKKQRNSEENLGYQTSIGQQMNELRSLLGE